MTESPIGLTFPRVALLDFTSSSKRFAVKLLLEGCGVYASDGRTEQESERVYCLLSLGSRKELLR